MSHDVECPHKQNGLCQISTTLASMPVPLADDACAACILQTNPRSVNRVTCSKAIHMRSLAGLTPSQELLDCVNPPKDGVGTELKRLIERTQALLAMFRLAWIVPTTFNCGCDATRNRLNAEGPEACVANRRFHVMDIYERWRTYLPAIRFVPFVRLLITAYLQRAVHNFRRKGAV